MSSELQPSWAQKIRKYSIATDWLISSALSIGSIIPVFGVLFQLGHRRYQGIPLGEQKIFDLDGQPLTGEQVCGLTQNAMMWERVFTKQKTSVLDKIFLGLYMVLPSPVLFSELLWVAPITLVLSPVLIPLEQCAKGIRSLFRKEKSTETQKQITEEEQHLGDKSESLSPTQAFKDLPLQTQPLESQPEISLDDLKISKTSMTPMQKAYSEKSENKKNKKEKLLEVVNVYCPNLREQVYGYTEERCAAIYREYQAYVNLAYSVEDTKRPQMSSVSVANEINKKIPVYLRSLMARNLEHSSESVHSQFKKSK